MWKIPLFNLDYDENETNAVLEVLKSKWLTIGPKTQIFEDNFSNYLGNNISSVAVSSCTAALHIALLATDIKQGDEVIISGLSFVACLNVVKLMGATPVLADSKSFEDWNVSPEDIESKITTKTKALIIVHFAGYPCDMDEIMQITKKYNLILIEDVAHAVGAEYKSGKCGIFGDISCFSFFSNKNLSTGEGGMAVTKSPELYKKLKLIRSHGMTSMTVERHNNKTISYDVIMPGLNYRIDEIRSSLGIEQLKKLDENNNNRKTIVETYHKELDSNKTVVIPWTDPLTDRTSSYHIFTILLPENINRQMLMNYMKNNGIQTSIHYPSFKEFFYYKDILKVELNVADEISKRVLTLPLYPSLKIEDIKTISHALKEALTKC